MYAYCRIDEWLKHLHPLEGESLTIYTILQAMLPSADLCLFSGQDELLALGLSLLLSDETLYTWISNSVPISNNLRYKKIVAFLVLYNGVGSIWSYIVYVTPNRAHPIVMKCMWITTSDLHFNLNHPVC